ncbi:MAG: isoleucine--tRNA ligase [Wolbachia endosymbiont of Menacanthus eurysternus]|nr:MAG: isoleucine--tRNA ligase [Wolbachia endosymbiont of Menacanthus eurysternus]
MKYYSDTTNNPDFVSLEDEIIKYWQKNKIFERSLEKCSKFNCFVFYDGPPFANGLPHYGHLLTGFIKDTFARYQTMLQKRVKRGFGWDCHGLPAEMSAEKELGISGKIEIEKFGIKKFNDYCRASVMKFTSEWEKYINRQARWVDFHNNYKTMDKSFMESVMWAFKQLYDKGLVYESIRVVPYSWACETPISNFETKLDNAYRKRTSKTVTVAFELLENPKKLKQKCNLLAWTTTPWTLPSNLALAIGKDIDYCVVLINNEIYIFSENYLEKFMGYCKQSNILYENYDIQLKANDLVNLTYKPLFSYFQNVRNAFRVFIADYVTAECGTGIVHTAPGFGEEDFYLCKNHNIPAICPIDNRGKFTSEVLDLAGVHVFDANDIIIKKLKERGIWIKAEQYVHNYPHCWRTDTPLIYRTMSSWYIAVTKFKNRMIELNKKVNWIPDHIKDGQFGKWLEGVHDWSISRNRFWGTPIPIWKSDDIRYPRIDVYGSIAELEKDFNVKINDLHRPFIDALTRPNPNDPTGKSIMRRIPDIFDCWFESGSVPFAQVHYPFKNKEWFENNFPADFITEYIAQTRGWFYTLFVLSTALFDSEPFKNCVCHGVILDTNGQKLSKRLNNYSDPMIIFNKYGSDALRFLMLSGSITQGGNLMLDKNGNLIRDVLKNVIKPIWNSYHFFTMYANADGIKAKICKSPYQNIIDRYMVSKCFESIKNIQISMNNYNSQMACKILVDFFEILNNWYIRRNRERFWKNDLDQDKTDAYNVLYIIFYYILRAAAPLLPFITETIWQGLKYKKTSVHLTSFPQIEKFDSKLITRMDLVRKICNSALSIRNTFNIRIRQPLHKMIIYHQSFCDNFSNKLSTNSKSHTTQQTNNTENCHTTNLNEYQEIIKNEVNVKKIELVNDFKDIASLELKLNLFILGRKIPNKIKKLVQYTKEGKWKQTKDKQIFLGDNIEGYLINEGEYEILLKANSKYSSVFDNNKGIVILNTELNNELILEGLARDIVRFIQETRKQVNFHISDKINIIIRTKDNKIKEAVNLWTEYIKKQTLALSLKTNVEVGENFYFKKYQNLIIGINKPNH